MTPVNETSYIVFDTESVIDGQLLARVRYSGEKITPEKAIRRYEKELESASMQGAKKPFLPVTFHVPVAIAVARVDKNFRLLDLACLDAPRYDPREIVKLFWKGVEAYEGAVLVDFNGRGFDLPLLTLSAFRFGISCPRYFADPDRFGFRYRFTDKHLDLQDWISEYGAFRVTGGLNLLAKMLGKPGKMETKGDQVQEMFDRGQLREINDYCLFDVLDTYFVFLRSRMMSGRLTLDQEQALVASAKEWIEEKASENDALGKYLDQFGAWSPEPFV